MLTTRVIACFDVKGGRVTKARRFQDNVDVGDAAEVARLMYADGVDEIVFYDITASPERRRADLETVRAVAHNVFVPLTVGGGVRDLEDMHAVLAAGAEKISIDSMAVRNPTLITAGSREFGRQCMVLSMQVQRVASRLRCRAGTRCSSTAPGSRPAWTRWSGRAAARSSAPARSW